MTNTCILFSYIILDVEISEKTGKDMSFGGFLIIQYLANLFKTCFTGGSKMLTITLTIKIMLLMDAVLLNPGVAEEGPCES